MAVKSGQIVMTKDGFLIDRVQTGGVSNIGIPEEPIYELGNYRTLTTIRDTADLSFDIESYDVSCKMEALLLGLDPTTVTTGQQFDFNLGLPFNVLSPFRSSQNYFNTIRGLQVRDQAERQPDLLPQGGLGLLHPWQPDRGHVHQ